MVNYAYNEVKNGGSITIVVKQKYGNYTISTSKISMKSTILNVKRTKSYNGRQTEKKTLRASFGLRYEIEPEGILDPDRLCPSYRPASVDL